MAVDWPGCKWLVCLNKLPRADWSGRVIAKVGVMAPDYDYLSDDRPEL